ncbi:MAG: hypothetical protein II304_06995 [Bacteroidales bacterium]|nr:hypothetical protein [Bacteroidales bacterium]
MNMTEIEARGKIKYRIANEMRKAGENKEEYEDLEIALQVMKEIREYRELGTVEELKALKEKQAPMKPLYVPVDDNCLYQEYRCPDCNEWLPYKFKQRRCLCGQRIDWD